MDKKKIFLVSLGHLSCDVNSGALPALLPLLITLYDFNYQAAAGLMFAFSMLSSIVQPVFGLLADRHSKPWFIPVGVLLAGGGLSVVGFLDTYWTIFAAVMVCGLGGSLFHPEGARFANKVSGTSKGTGMSLFSIGGNGGFVVGPLLAVAATKLFGLHGTAVFGVLAMCTSGALLWMIYTMKAPAPAVPVHSTGPNTAEGSASGSTSATPHVAGIAEVPARNNWREFSKLTVLIMSRSTIFMGFNTFLPLYWISHFGASNASGALVLTGFCSLGVFWNLTGGIMSDRMGYVQMIRLAFPMLIPFVALFAVQDSATVALLLLIPISFGLYAAMSCTVVLGQQYLARNIGFASGVTLGLATSVGGIMAPVLGWIADTHGLQSAFFVLCGVSCIAATFAWLLRPASVSR